MKIDIKVFEGVSVAAFENIPSTDNASVVCDIMNTIGNAGIDLDMISLEVSPSNKINAGFTFEDANLSSLIKAVKGFNVPTPIINCGNVKFVLKSPEMIGKAGFTASVLTAIHSIGCTPLLITTGIDEISILVSNSDSADVAKKLEEMFK